MKSYRVWVSVAVLVAILSTACRMPLGVAHADAGDGSLDHTRLNQCTDIKTRIFACGANDKSIRFTVRPRLLRGQVAWVLLDPDSQVRWSSQARAPYWFGHTRRFESMPGNWKLQVVVVKASGEYHTAWQAD